MSSRKEELLEMHCPMGVTQKIIGGKWKLLIIWRLKGGVMRFNQLQKSLTDIRQGCLTQQLRELEEDGLIHREVYKEVPPKVEYSLTNIGEKFLKVSYIMSEWGTEYQELLKSDLL
ncbi:MAG: HxlR family transcriptional regulator [Clostridiaceae bacterium]|jgi:DNA-binding HxlR family transcriptional regulator|nr:HxlR family transcriptional regulator [Clostridiaceae bacterium]